MKVARGDHLDMQQALMCHVPFFMLASSCPPKTTLLQHLHEMHKMALELPHSWHALVCALGRRHSCNAWGRYAADGASIRSSCCARPTQAHAL